MAKKLAQSKQTNKIQRAEWKGYANIDLSEEDKQAIRGGVLDGEVVLDILGDMLSSGHKIAITHDSEKDTVAAAATGVYTHCPNAGYTLTCFGRSLTSVLEVLAYKHEVIAKGNWAQWVTGKREYDDIG